MHDKLSDAHMTFLSVFNLFTAFIKSVHYSIAT